MRALPFLLVFAGLQLAHAVSMLSRPPPAPPADLAVQDSDRDYYEVLGVKRGASTGDVLPPPSPAHFGSASG